MHRISLLTAVAATLLSAGCGFNHFSSTAIVYEFGGDRMLHVAFVPRVLADGSDAAARRQALLNDVVRSVGGYAYVEKGSGDFRRLLDGHIVDEPADVLFVQGPPEMAGYLTWRLQEDFGQPAPVVVSIPAQAHRIIPVSARSGRRPRDAESR